MRKNPTPSEFVLFGYLNAQQLGVPFRRQQVVLGRYIVDLLCRRLKLVVEVDGGRHKLPDVAVADAHRDSALRRAGYTVLRLPAKVVLEQPADAVAQVKAVVSELLG